MALRKKKTRDFEAEDRETVLKPGAEWVKRVNVDIPIWAIKALDHEATRRGITRQALIKTWLIDRLDLIQEKKNVG